MQQDWAIRKATALSQAWHLQFGDWPTPGALALHLSQATAETRCGDAWPGPDGKLGTADDSHNWGACTLRKLNVMERAAIANAGIHPTVGPGHEAAARAAQAAIVKAGLPLPQGEIHCDSAPGIGPYFTYFATFPDYEVECETISGDVSGARYYLRIADGAPGHVKSLHLVSLNPSCDVETYARTAYRQHYYTGTSPDPSVDIARYVRFMGQFVPAFQKLLEGFDPAACTPVPAPPPRLPLCEGMTGADVKHPQIVFGVSPDGDWGPATDAACSRWRLAHALPVPPVQWDRDCENVLAGKNADDEPPAPRLTHVVNPPVDWDAMREERDRAFAEAA